MTALREDAFLSQMKDRANTAGQGILTDIPIPLAALTLANTTLTSSSGVEHIELDATNETATVSFIIPMNYDEAEYESGRYHSGDELHLVITAAGDIAGASTLEIDSVESWELGETAVTSNTVSVAAQTVSTTTISPFDFNLSGYGFQPGDAVSITFSMGTDSTNDIEVYGVCVRYRSTIVANDNATDR